MNKIAIEVEKVTFQDKDDISFVAPLVTPILPITLVVASSSIMSDDGDDRQHLISSLSKLLEKNKFVKSSERTLDDVMDRV